MWNILILMDYFSSRYIVVVDKRESKISELISRIGESVLMWRDWSDKSITNYFACFACFPKTGSYVTWCSFVYMNSAAFPEVFIVPIMCM